MPATKRLITICLVLLAVVAVIASGCSQQYEEGKAKKVITDIEAAAEKKEIGKIANALEDRYSDPQEFNRESIRREPRRPSLRNTLSSFVSTSFSPHLTAVLIAAGSATSSCTCENGRHTKNVLMRGGLGLQGQP